MKFKMTENQAERVVDHAIYIYEKFIKRNQEEEVPFTKIVVYGKTDFRDSNREDLFLNDEEFVYENKKGVHEFTSKRFGTFTLQGLCVFMSWLRLRDAEAYFN